jgi:hypothetical protein
MVEKLEEIKLTGNHRDVDCSIFSPVGAPVVIGWLHDEFGSTFSENLDGKSNEIKNSHGDISHYVLGDAKENQYDKRRTRYAESFWTAAIQFYRKR